MTHRRMTSREGQVLILFLLMLLAVLGVLALTLDYGFVLLSRRSMQAAVNAGALEGGRQLDSTGRDNAKVLIGNIFDDNFDPSANPTTLSAGVEHSLVSVTSDQGTVLGSGSGSQDLFETRTQYLYRPLPELNESNAIHGDLVFGDYLEDSASHAENSHYLRDDFDVTVDGDAFLVRLRRTPARVGIANSLDRQVGISSSGTGSPMLLGRLLPFVHPDGGFDIRKDGVTVRATAISQQQPIVNIGTSTDPLVYPALSFAKFPGGSEFFEITNPVYNLGASVLLGDEVDDPNTVPSGYLPLLGTLDGTHYVLGFALREIDSNASGKVVNASPHLHQAKVALDLLTEEAYNFVLEWHLSLASEASSELAKMPVLRRAMD